jgi:AraC-like DNA-binding protein
MPKAPTLIDTMDVPIKNKLDKQELFRIKRMKELIKTTRPHGHKSYLEIIYLEQGAGIHQIDFNRFLIVPPSIYLIMPGQIHNWELTEVPKGFVIMIQQDFLLGHPLYELLFQTFPVPFPSGFQLEDNGAVFADIFKNIELEYDQKAPHYEAIIQTYLTLLFNLLKRELNAEPTHVHPSLLKNFFVLLDERFRKNHTVQFYADKLYITTKTLNAACKKALGKTAGELIKEKLTVESKKQLLYTQKSLTELAFDLGFTDSSHFNKFFKRQTGVLPGVYRKGIS